MSEDGANLARQEIREKGHAQVGLGVVICIGFFGSLVALLYVPIPPDSKEAVMLVIGSLIASFSTVVGFYFGSSSSSKSKDQTIDTLSKQEAP
jgi:hypothetical protein